ncbi:hypothetical protein A2738_00715 [Candidatus Nomurabacteria bacterium RIFCSPHIGHO2_01_FULL_42_15]|uniref:Nudix hydrolase domain-containing protein n=1 Tax=Candidatus Nomurabacteria bacterium RIFCSPHIGHO2_01_FULL_42_15 TaxID=1801742 RepID=A0A1F6VFQ4_9BACT|nr:MAG: hypothetical protein A2738_00715 [Candidatus Nomurabacteria bacterium RIFCSPHIGHO2_01_FULL_42_15]OGI93180.1 MAG: hypothetical protein A3A99_01455 [Candidatus Nomurabacteria bacterium RIFCSPLOWO2_01_FULL_41_18]
MTNLNYENKRILDVIDKNDKIVDSKSRIDIHRLGLLHREIQVWIFDKNKNIFFQKMGLHKKSAGLLDATIAGHPNKGEEYLDAAVRETKEETGISVTPSDLIFIKKLKVLHHTQDDFGGTINNFIRSVYVLKKPINEEMLKKEDGIPGGGFQKLSYNFLLNLPKEYKQMIKNHILEKEIPDILKYLSAWKN